MLQLNTSRTVGAGMLVGLALALAWPNAASAQTIGGLGDLTDLLNQFGQGATDGSTNGDGGGTDGGDSGGDTPPADNSMLRVPLVRNNFDAHRGDAIVQRAPSSQVRQSTAIFQGDTSFYTEPAPPDEPGFLESAFQQIILTLLDTLIDIAGESPLGSLGSLSGLGGLGGFGNLGQILDPDAPPNQQGDVTPIGNSTTSGQGTQQQIQKAVSGRAILAQPRNN